MNNLKGLIGTAFGVALLNVIGVSTAFAATPAYYTTPVTIYNCTNCKYDRNTDKLSCNDTPRSFTVYTGVVTHCSQRSCDYSPLKANIVPKTAKSVSASYALNIARQTSPWNELVLSEPGFNVSPQPSNSGLYNWGQMDSKVIVIQVKANLPQKGQFPWGFGTSDLIFPKFGKVTTNCTIEKSA